MTSPFTVTTQLRCPNCGQTGIAAELPDDEVDLTASHISGFRQDGNMVTCHLCSHTFPLESPG
jgi:hypothetical protein